MIKAIDNIQKQKIFFSSKEKEMLEKISQQLIKFKLLKAKVFKKNGLR